jgi:Kef-type K+ transport system membrane component KefB
MSSTHFVQLVVQLAILLGVAVACGRVMQRLRQPPVLGEILGGVLLGPSLLGALAPSLHQALAGAGGPHDPLAALSRLGMLFFLFAVGLETDLATLRGTARAAVSIGLAGTLLPLAAGVALVSLSPAAFWGPGASQHGLPFALFVGFNLANSALPVLARTLRDLGYLERRFGTTCLAAAVVDDLVTWAGAAIVLRQLADRRADAAAPHLQLALLVLLAAAFWLGPRLLDRVGASAPVGPSLIAATSAALLAVAAASEALGAHAFLGAFLFGVALARGDGPHAEARHTIARFAAGFFAPLYFVSLGLRTDFVGGFDLALVAVVLLAAAASKLLGVLLGARLAGLPLGREAWAMAFGLNARGATGLILAAIGREAGLIDDRLFVALAATAILTSLAAGPLMHVTLAGAWRLPGRRGAPAGDASDAYSDL